MSIKDKMRMLVWITKPIIIIIPVLKNNKASCILVYKKRKWWEWWDWFVVAERCKCLFVFGSFFILIPCHLVICLSLFLISYWLSKYWLITFSFLAFLQKCTYPKKNNFFKDFFISLSIKHSTSKILKKLFLFKFPKFYVIYYIY